MTAKKPTRFYRINQVLGDTNATPPIPPIIPLSRSCWLAGVKAGRYPRPVKIGSRAVAWRSDEIDALLVSLGGQQS